jgi:hypothetical protein
LPYFGFDFSPPPAVCGGNRRVIDLLIAAGLCYNAKGTVDNDGAALVQTVGCVFLSMNLTVFLCPDSIGGRRGMCFWARAVLFRK